MPYHTVRCFDAITRDTKSAFKHSLGSSLAANSLCTLFTMVLLRDSVYAVILRILQLIFALTSLILLCLRLRVYNLGSDTPPVVLTLNAAVAGLSLLGSFIGLSYLIHESMGTRMCD